MKYQDKKIDLYIAEYNLVTNKVTALSMKFSSGTYLIPISLITGIFSIYIDVENFFINFFFILLPIILTLYIYNHIRYMALQFKLSGYARHLEKKINLLLDDEILLWENKLARNNQQNLFEGIFLGISYIGILLFIYYIGYNSLATVIYKNQMDYNFSIFISIIYYCLFIYLFFFLTFFTNEHQKTYSKANFFNSFHFFEEYKKKRKIKKSSVIRISILTAIFLLSPTSLVPLIYCYKNISPNASVEYDYIIILGNKTTDNNPSSDMLSRLNRTIDYVESNKDIILVLSGGNNEAVIMENYLNDLNVPNKIILEDKSLDTYQNITNTIPLVNNRTAVLTSDYHVFRVGLITRKQGLNYFFISATSKHNIFFDIIKESYIVFFEIFRT